MLKAVSVVGALCFTIVGATYRMIQDNSNQTRDQVNTMIEDKTVRILDQVKMLKDETNRGFDNILRRLETIDGHFDLYKERVSKIEGQLTAGIQKKNNDI